MFSQNSLSVFWEWFRTELMFPIMLFDKQHTNCASVRKPTGSLTKTKHTTMNQS